MTASNNDVAGPTFADFQKSFPKGTPFKIEYDGFIGEVIGWYERRDGKHGVVGQQYGSDIVHVYGVKHVKLDYKV